jgi:myo-inositol-1-phosphate synthase
LNEGHKKYLGAEFILASYDVLDSPSRMRYFYKLEDFYQRIDPDLESPYVDQRMRNSNRSKLLIQMNDELNFKSIKDFAQQERYPEKQIYINVMPIFISAVCKAFTALKDKGIEFVGFDAKTYEEPFTNELKVDFSKVNYTPIRIR